MKFLFFSACLATFQKGLKTGKVPKVASETLENEVSMLFRMSCHLLERLGNGKSA
jgi:hypothetical protein